MKRYLLLFSLWIGTSTVFSQFDSTLYKFKTATYDSARLKYARALTYMHINTNPDSGRYYANIGKDLALQLNDTSLFVEMQTADAASYYLRGDHINCIKVCNRALAVIDSLQIDQEWRAPLYTQLSTSYLNLGVFNYAERYMNMEYEAYKNGSDSLKMINALTRLSDHYVEFENYDAAEQTALEAKELLKHVSTTKRDKSWMRYVTISNLWTVYRQQQRYKEAVQLFKEEYIPASQDYGAGDIAYQLIVLIHSAPMQKRDEVLTLLQSKGLSTDVDLLFESAYMHLDSLIESYSRGHSAVGVLQQKARLAHWQGNYQLALATAGKALILVEQYRLRARKGQVLEHIEQNAWALYEEASNKEDALHYLRMAYDHNLLQQELNDSLYNSRETNQLVTNQIHLDEQAQKAKAQARLEQEQLLAAEDKKQQRLVSYILAVGLGGVMLIALLLVRSIRNKRKANQIIQAQKHEVELQRDMVEEKNREILDSIQYAKRLQEAILPPKRLVKEWLPQSFILYKPKDIVAGDFYWMETVGDVIYFAVADCTGHGVPGAMVSVVCSSALTKSLLEEGITEPAKILDRSRELVVERFERSEDEVKDGMDISLCAMNLLTGTLQWAGANNPLWLIRRGSEQVEEIKADKQPIGRYAIEAPFTNHIVQLNKGDALYLFSDGYSDQFGGEKGKKYKSGVLKKKLLNIQEVDMSEQRNLLNAEFERWKGDIEQVDDVCIIGVRV